MRAARRSLDRPRPAALASCHRPRSPCGEAQGVGGRRAPNDSQPTDIALSCHRRVHFGPILAMFSSSVQLAPWVSCQRRSRHDDAVCRWARPQPELPRAPAAHLVECAVGAVPYCTLDHLRRMPLGSLPARAPARSCRPSRRVCSRRRPVLHTRPSPPYAAGLAPSPSSRALLPPISSSVQSAPSRTAHSTISAVCRWARSQPELPRAPAAHLVECAVGAVPYCTLDHLRRMPLGRLARS